ncbi:MAG: hypothetical protein AABY07_03510 [Nanoarchaeota archaeon]|mgnify:CR=1 FL=1
MLVLNNLSNNELLKLLAIITLTDGTISKERYKESTYLKCIKLETVSYNSDQHRLFNYLCKKVFGKETKRFTYLNNKNKKILCSKLFGKNNILKILTLSPTYKTSKYYKEETNDFLNAAQPTIKFILSDKNIRIKKLALRTYFDFDGCIIPSFKIKNKKDKKKGKVYKYYHLCFDCVIKISETNPNLVKELIKLCNSIGINALIDRDKRNWSGIGGIRISQLEGIKRFIKFGGPITNVKVSSKSKRFHMKTKLSLCKAVMKILNSGMQRSYYTKDYEKALEKKEELNKLLMSEIENYNKLK